MPDRTFDALIIGAGHNGLTLACYLARSGLEVAVFERRLEEGGGLCTEELTRPGFLHNVHANYHTFVDLAPAYEDLELYEQGLRYVRPEVQMASIFRDGTPLHDGAVLIRRDRVLAAACVMPLTASETLTERQMGLRHRAALGITENTDAVAVVVSEETGIISVTHNGRMIRRLDAARLEHVLTTFYRPSGRRAWFSFGRRADKKDVDAP